LFQKVFNGYIFYFLGQLFGGQLFELFARETNLKKQSSVQLNTFFNIFFITFGWFSGAPPARRARPS
jgi:hypothetical protein